MTRVPKDLAYQKGIKAINLTKTAANILSLPLLKVYTGSCLACSTIYFMSSPVSPKLSFFQPQHR